MQLFRRDDESKQKRIDESEPKNFENSKKHLRGPGVLSIPGPFGGWLSVSENLLLTPTPNNVSSATDNLRDAHSSIEAVTNIDWWMYLLLASFKKLDSFSRVFFNHGRFDRFLFVKHNLRQRQSFDVSNNLPVCIMYPTQCQRYNPSWANAFELRKRFGSGANFQNHKYDQDLQWDPPCQRSTFLLIIF